MYFVKIQCEECILKPDKAVIPDTRTVAFQPQ